MLRKLTKIKEKIITLLSIHILIYKSTNNQIRYNQSNVLSWRDVATDIQLYLYKDFLRTNIHIDGMGLK